MRAVKVLDARWRVSLVHSGTVARRSALPSHTPRRTTGPSVGWTRAHTPILPILGARRDVRPGRRSFARRCVGATRPGAFRRDHDRDATGRWLQRTTTPVAARELLHAAAGARQGRDGARSTAHAWRAATRSGVVVGAIRRTRTRGGACSEPRRLQLKGIGIRQRTAPMWQARDGTKSQIVWRVAQEGKGGWDRYGEEEVDDAVRRGRRAMGEEPDLKTRVMSELGEYVAELAAAALYAGASA